MVWEHNLKLKIGNKPLVRDNKYKYLGLLLDEKLIWRDHLLELRAKLRKLNFLFFHLKSYYNTKHLRKLYLPLYESTMTYGIIHWEGSKHIEAIKVLQNKVCRNILSLAPRTTESIIYSKMKVMGLEDLYKYRLRMFVIKNLGLFALHHNNYMHTRQADARMIEIPTWWKEHSRWQAGYRGPSLYNNLPGSVRGEKRLSAFKRLIKMS